MSEFHIHPLDGNDTWNGTQVAPWRTIGKANARALPGDVVVLAGGKYSDAPNARGVTFRRRELKDEVVIARKLVVNVSDMKITGVTRIEGGVTFGPNALRCLVASVRPSSPGQVGGIIGPIEYGGSQASAATANTLQGCRIDGPYLYAHAYGDDRQPGVPHISGNRIVQCEIVLTRKAGSAGVIWRMSSFDDGLIARNRIRLVHPDGVGTSDDSASMKMLWCRGNEFRFNSWTFDHPADCFDGQGPFWMMRDATSFNRFDDEQFIVERGGLWWSGNTAGTSDGVTGGFCSCKGNEYFDCSWHFPARGIWYQCPPNGDAHSNSRVFCDSFDWYKAPKNQPGVTLAAYREPGE